jgi:hypothetical protein
MNIDLTIPEPALWVLGFFAALIVLNLILERIPR